jgi:mannose-6-phosphate isomerase-like protein (cupin superfamily)
MNSKGMIRASSEGLKLAGPGGRSILLKAGSAETQGAYSLLKFTAPPGSPWSTHHVHTATEAWYVLDGELTFRLGETILPASAGSFVLAPGGTPHSQVNSGPGPAEYLVIFSPGGLEDFFVHLTRLIESAQPNQPGPDALNALAEQYGIVTV